MSIETQYFPSDKNYLLKTVQGFSKDLLLETWAQEAYQGYLINENPMGLEDDFTLYIKEEIHNGKFILDEVFDLITAIYRYKHGDNQLSFLWDGRTHMEYYDEEWRTTFIEWAKVLCQKKDVYRAVIKAAMADEKINTEFLSHSLKRAVLKHFDVRLTRSQRLMALSA